MRRLNAPSVQLSLWLDCCTQRFFARRIMVLDRGHIKELAPPQELLQDKTSVFYGMAKDANLVH